MREASKALQFEKAARLRDEIKALETLNLRGDLAKHAQPEVFYVDPRKGLKGLKQVLKLDSIPRTIDGVDIAHLGGNEMVGSLVSFIDGLPFKPGYRRYQIKSVAGIDDFAAIREVVTRRIKGLQERDEPFPDIWLIDGGKGQLSAALDAFESLRVVPPTLIALAKREEEIFVHGRSEPIVLSRRRSPCGCYNTSATRPTASPSTIIICSGRSGRWVTRMSESSVNRRRIEDDRDLLAEIANLRRNSHDSLLRIVLWDGGNAERCAIEADHIHNVPDLLRILSRATCLLLGVERDCTSARLRLQLALGLFATIECHVEIRRARTRCD